MNVLESFSLAGKVALVTGGAGHKVTGMPTVFWTLSLGRSKISVTGAIYSLKVEIFPVLGKMAAVFRGSNVADPGNSPPPGSDGFHAAV